MEIMKSFITFSTLMLYSLITYSSTIIEDTIIYKKTNNKNMFLYITYPKTEKNNLPCIVFFNGGGWVSRKMEQFDSYCKYFANKGFICIRAEYRVSKINNSTPFESLSDARSSIRYIRKNAFSLKIDPHKIAAAGGSAGGHLAAACACIKKYDDIKDDISISCIPNALILFNPVIDNGPSGYGFDRIGKEYKDFSPLHNIHKSMPPTTIFIGTKDRLIPLETIKYYKKSMDLLGVRCDLHLYENEGHGFFNHKEFTPIMLDNMEKFFQSLHWLK